jgi:hypothetical protein
VDPSTSKNGLAKICFVIICAGMSDSSTTVVEVWQLIVLRATGFMTDFSMELYRRHSCFAHNIACAAFEAAHLVDTNEGCLSRLYSHINSNDIF